MRSNRSTDNRSREMVKLDILLDLPSIDLSAPADTSSPLRTPSVALSGKLVLITDRPLQIKHIALKYDCVNSHIDLEVRPVQVMAKYRMMCMCTITFTVL
jgi:hypothetical protein